MQEAIAGCRSTLLTIQPQADPICFSAVINQTLLEPWVFQSFLGRDALFRVVNKYLAQKIQELTIEGCVGGNEFLESYGQIGSQQ